VPPLARWLTDGQLFPSFVHHYAVVLDLTDAAPLAAQFPGIALPESSNRWVRKRQVEYAGGRYCAREALRAAGSRVAELPLGRGASGAPSWPDGIVGAITHSNGFAGAAVAASSRARGVGLDVERAMTDELAAQILDKIASREELDAARSATQWSTGEALTVIFSAKETVFKALYSEVQRYFDFRDAALGRIDLAAGTFTASLLTTLTPSLPSGMVLHGCLVRHESNVCTAMTLPRT
jgi:enterobactin synthetase component D